MSLINWLRDKPTPRFYLGSRAGYGIRFESDQPVLGSFGLLRFDSTKGSDADWEPFGNSRFMVPIEVQTANPVRSNRRSIAKPHQNPATSIESDWEQPFQEAYELLKNQSLRKLVLARKRIYSLSSEPNPLDLLQGLIEAFPTCTPYYFEPQPGIVFLGSSPEQLYRRQSQNFYTEAQAGSMPRGLSLEEDQQNQQILETNDRFIHEHEIVVNNILLSLQSLCLDYRITLRREVVKLPNIMHLRTQFQGVLAPSITDEHILTALHPTAAVCGWPIVESRKSISQIESFDRGFYAGTMGYIGPMESEFYVAIRGALLHFPNLSAFAGAGLVPGSISNLESNEISHKMSFWEKLL
ncbi:MAG: isochorismate synthase [Myxococcaceae bacterium]|nr:isochorismate synthase [Myxococcaceae bacterium]MBH2006207.1 isochorismate synthase [Myxococcaceae bacterium]